MIEMFKRWFKKSAMIMLLLFVTLSFSGFSSVNSYVLEKEDGVVAETINITLDPQAIINEGLSLNQFAQKLDKLFSQQIEAIKYSYFNPNAIAKGESGLEQNIYSCEILFLNDNVYQNFYNQNNLKQIQRTEKHFFYTSVYLTSHSIYEKHPDLYDKLLEVIPGEINVYSTYQTKYRRVHSDADEVVRQNNLYYHIWEIDGESINQPIEIYYNVANSGVWIALGIAASLMTCFVCFIIYVINSKHKQNKLIKLLSEDDENIK